MFQGKNRPLSAEVQKKTELKKPCSLFLNGCLISPVRNDTRLPGLSHTRTEIQLSSGNTVRQACRRKRKTDSPAFCRHRFFRRERRYPFSGKRHGKSRVFSRLLLPRLPVFRDSHLLRAILLISGKKRGKNGHLSHLANCFAVKLFR